MVYFGGDCFLAHSYSPQKEPARSGQDKVMITNKYSLRSATKQLQLKKYSLPIIIYTLLGLAATVSLIYLQGDRLSQAALADSPTNVAPFSAFSANPTQAIANQSQTCPLDVMVVFDVSASMEDQTICHDCWVRNSYNPDWPGNGNFNPIPYDKCCWSGNVVVTIFNG
jgi:hypothetical protein